VSTDHGGDCSCGVLGRYDLFHLEGFFCFSVFVLILVAVYSGAMTYFILKVFFCRFKRICGVLRRYHVSQLEGVPFFGGVQGLGLRA